MMVLDCWFFLGFVVRVVVNNRLGSRNMGLGRAKREKNDEFYTRLTDIGAELGHYTEHFKGRTVLCNCDDPFKSAFFEYFVLNFNKLGLGRLIATCYDDSPYLARMSPLIDAMKFADDNTSSANRPAYKAIVDNVPNRFGDAAALSGENIHELLSYGGNQLSVLDGNGDFRSPECEALLDEADIVVTNPPFSLFREYVAQLMKHGKRFIILGNMNMIACREIFPLIMQNRIWLGYNNGSKTYLLPDGSGMTLGNTWWFTNLDIGKLHDTLHLESRYSGHEDEYQKYDNYDAINVDSISRIPCDYDGVMGVPITFLDKYSPEQFTILGCSYSHGVHPSLHHDDKPWAPFINGHEVYKRLFIQRNHPK